ncbi:uncharacterized protein LOC111868088 [Cryptotermes secundus]|uniref:uncharacterized protein LOC111868088 n=1 Tax=Cryptotermes secundus TaxID=105785 RepID=UPI000CD7CECB|nr:uncharacterized protein LOC111868088 [Cryptotermes secundus]
MDVEESTSKPGEQQPSDKPVRLPPIVLTSTTNLMQLQRKVKELVTGNFEFRNTRSGTRIVTKEMADFSAIKTFLESTNLSYFTFFPKSEKPIKAVIRHLPHNTPAEDISDGLMSLGFDVISVKQMTSRRTPPEGTDNIYLPLFLITLPRTEKSQEVFRLTNLCHIAIKECPEKENSASTPVCCNCRLAEGEKPHPANYRGCNHAKEVQQRRKAQRTSKSTGRVFSSATVTPGVSFAAALRGSAAEQNQRPQGSHVPVAPATTKKHSVPAPALQTETDFYCYKMEMQQLMEMLARMEASMKTDKEEMLKEMRAWREKADADSKAWREEVAAWREKTSAETRTTPAMTAQQEEVPIVISKQKHVKTCQQLLQLYSTDLAEFFEHLFTVKVDSGRRLQKRNASSRSGNTLGALLK